MAQRSLAEIATGAAVLIVAAGFLAFALVNTGRARVGGTSLSARFDNVGGITSGAEVRVGGLKVGSVDSIRIDPQTYQALVTFTVQGDLHLPTDSSAVISSGGLLGGATLTVQPGGADTMLKNGQMMTLTQSAVNLEDMLGKFIFNVGSLADASQKQLQQNAARLSESGPGPSGVRIDPPRPPLPPGQGQPRR